MHSMAAARFGNAGKRFNQGVSRSPHKSQLETMNTKTQRQQSLLPEGIPRYIRCYDNGGETWDRYTVLFTGRYRHKTAGEFMYIGMSSNPFNPQGFGQHSTSFPQLDQGGYKHLGRKIKFDQLPDDCKALVVSDYKDIWDLN